ncbi:MAG TPA: tetratricopeptide repeat protein, partial [Phenylobacterium sp.]|nr:tetratricopeptide repeat protein [Phenylobacterium sp.]
MTPDRALALLDDPATAPEGLSWFQARAKALPDSVRAMFDLAGAYDRLGRSGEAAPVYEKVLLLGLDQLTEADQARWHVQYGGTLRVLGRLQESRAVLEGGVSLFPEHGALPVFLAFTELALGRRDAALAALLAGAAASDPYGSRARYRRAITACASEWLP